MIILCYKYFNFIAMIQKIIFYVLAGILIFFIGGGLLFNELLPAKTIDFQSYFKKNKHFSSIEEGMEIDVKKLSKKDVYLMVTLKPFAAGPIEHIHEDFDEYFFVEKGTLSLLINGQKRILNAGESILIPKGTPHKPFNETDQEVILNDKNEVHPTMPAYFAYGLSQVYPVIDKHGSKSPKVLFELARLGQGFDTWLADTPLFLQKAIRWILKPLAHVF